jgi:hypothetical protein
MLNEVTDRYVLIETARIFLETVHTYIMRTLNPVITLPDNILFLFMRKHVQNYERK